MRTTQQPNSSINPIHSTTILFFLVCLFALFFAPCFLVAADFAGSLKSVSITDSAGTNQPPVAVINYTQNGATYSFDASGSSDPDGSIVEYKWDFGDGTSASGTSVSHTFSAGDFAVTLNVRDDKEAVSLSQSLVQFALTLEKVGEQQLFSDRGGACRAGSPIAFKVSGTPNHTGILKAISFGVMGKGVVRPFRLALYTDINGKPGNLVPNSVTVEKSTSATTFEIIELPVEQGEPRVEANTQYWIIVETMGKYLFFSDKWVIAGQIGVKNNISSYNWPNWNGVVDQTLNSQVGACFFSYEY